MTLKFEATDQMKGGNAYGENLKPIVIYRTILRILGHYSDFSNLPFLFTGGLLK